MVLCVNFTAKDHSGSYGLSKLEKWKGYKSLFVRPGHIYRLYRYTWNVPSSPIGISTLPIASLYLKVLIKICFHYVHPECNIYFTQIMVSSFRLKAVQVQLLAFSHHQVINSIPWHYLVSWYVTFVAAAYLLHQCLDTRISKAVIMVMSNNFWCIIAEITL